MRPGKVLACAAIICAAMACALFPARPLAAADTLIEKRESLYNNIFIFRGVDTVTMTFGRNKRYYTESSMKVGDPNALVIEYSRYMTMGLAYAPKVERILEIGLGGGRITSYLHAYVPQAEILSVELDKDVVELARKYFDFQETDKLRAVVSDGRAYLMRDTSRWDIILLDAYRGPFVPFHLLTKEFYALVKSRLAPGGIVVQNIEPSTMLFNSAVATMHSVFPAVEFYDGVENVVAIGHDGPPLRQAEFLARAAKAQQQYKPRYDLRTMAAERRVLRKSSGKVLSDDFAPVETLRAIEVKNEKWKEGTDAPN